MKFVVVQQPKLSTFHETNGGGRKRNHIACVPSVPRDHIIYVIENVYLDFCDVNNTDMAANLTVSHRRAHK